MMQFLKKLNWRRALPEGWYFVHYQGGLPILQAAYWNGQWWFQHHNETISEVFGRVPGVNHGNH